MTRGRPPRPLRPVATVATVDDVVRIIHVRQLGHTWVEIAAVLGLTLRTITHARKTGVLTQLEKE